MKSCYKYWEVFVLLHIFFVGCKREVPEIITNEPEKPEEVFEADTLGYDSVDVFISGAEYVANNKWNACYWKNGATHILDTDHSIANDIIISDDDVIVGGEYDGKPCYWKNGSRTVIDDRTGRVKGIGYHKGELYLVGEVYEEDVNIFKAFVWNKAIKILGPGYASDIVFSDEDVYISGMDSKNPCYWKNGQKTILSENFGHGYAIEFQHNNVYVAGEYRPTNGGYYLAGYWKNGEFISPLGNSAYILNIGINRGDAYILGDEVDSKNADSVTNNAILVKGNNKTVLSAGENSVSGATDIAFNGTNEYVLGSYSLIFGPDRSPHACYWLNGKLHTIGRSQTIGSAIFLSPVASERK
jgi:hypothetical protein